MKKKNMETLQELIMKLRVDIRMSKEIDIDKRLYEI